MPGLPAGALRRYWIPDQRYMINLNGFTNLVCDLLTHYLELNDIRQQHSCRECVEWRNLSSVDGLHRSGFSSYGNSHMPRQIAACFWAV